MNGTDTCGHHENIRLLHPKTVIIAAAASVVVTHTHNPPSVYDHVRPSPPPISIQQWKAKERERRRHHGSCLTANVPSHFHHRSFGSFHHFAHRLRLVVYCPVRLIGAFGCYRNKCAIWRYSMMVIVWFISSLIHHHYHLLVLMYVHWFFR